MNQIRNCRFSGACLLLCCSITAAAAQTDARPEIPARLTLPQAVELALRQNTLLRLAQAQLTQAEGRSEQSTSGLYPQISLGVGDSYQAVNLRAQGIRLPFAPARVGPFQSFDGRGTVSQNLFHAPLWLGSRAGKMRLDASRSQAADARELVVLSVVSAYVQALRAETQAAALAAQVETAERLHQITADRFQGGIANAVEVKRARQQANNLRQVWLEARNSVTVAKLQLANLLQARISSRFELADISSCYETPQIDPETALARAAESRIDLKAAAQAVRAAELSVQSLKAQRLPTLQLQGSFGQSGDSPARNLDVYRVQGVLSVPLFTGHRISGEVREAEGRLEEARANLAAVRTQVETDALAALAGLDAAGREVEVAEDSSRLAKEELDLALARYQGGVSDNTEVVNAQDRIARAEENLVRARFNRNLARANLHRALGMAERTYSR
ncbi:MAG: TolC family protein [Acidobacteria bacterium]|nr:TolC family protein [Acidobacteriota bacterium]